jgi:Flp pilus assembly protein TadD
MVGHPRDRLLACVASALAITCSQASAEELGLLSVGEMTKRMEASKTQQYSILKLSEASNVNVDELRALLYPVRVQPVPDAQVEMAQGKRRLVTAPCQSAKTKIEQGEKLYGQKQYAAAGARYEEAVVLAPACYLAEAYLGDAYLFSGEPQLALAHYDKALALNPDDPAVHLFRSSAFRHMGRGKEWLDELRWAMTLKPRNPTVIRIFSQAMDRAPVRLQDVSVAPRGFARLEESKGVAIYFDQEQPAWLGYAICKGFWLGEPAHRKELTGTSERTFSLVEERECLAGLLTVYETSKKRDAGLDRLKRIVEDGAADEWIIYELGSLVDPQIVLKMPKTLQQGIHDFVARYVLVGAE